MNDKEKKCGRPSKYETDIKPYLSDIAEAVKSGATMQDIADSFDIAESTLYKYKKEKTEFSKALSVGRKQVVLKIKAALFKKATGFEYQEEKKVGKKDKDGESIILVEKYTRYCPPSETAAAMLLRNYDETWKDKDTISTDIKKQELELKKEMAKENIFDFEGEL